MSQSLADLFASSKTKQDMTSILYSASPIDEELLMGFPAAENMSNVTPPDDGKRRNQGR